MRRGERPKDRVAHEQPGDELRDEGGGRASPRVAFLGDKIVTSDMTWNLKKSCSDQTLRH